MQQREMGQESPPNGRPKNGRANVWLRPVVAAAATFVLLKLVSLANEPASLIVAGLVVIGGALWLTVTRRK